MALEDRKAADSTGAIASDGEDLEQKQYKRDISVIP